MFRAALVALAKRKPASPVAPRKKVLKRLGRSSSKGGTKGGRAGSARRRLSPARPSGNGGGGGASTKISATAGAAGAVGAAASAEDRRSGGDALVHVSSEEGRTPAASAATSHAAARAMTYRLATAVSTVVVPPLANAYLESMKQTLTPAVRRAQDGGLGGRGSGLDDSPVSQMEEYYTSKKGPLFATAVIAGTNAVKQASMLIPFCHPIPIQKCSFTFRRRAVGSSLSHSALPHRVVLRKRTSAPSPRPSRPEYSVLYCFCTVATEEYKTGVEMEALTGATVAAMTLYDMLKGLPGAQEDGLSLGESFVLAKRGGKNDFIKLLMSEPERPEVPPVGRHAALTEGAERRDRAAAAAAAATAASPEQGDGANSAAAAEEHDGEAETEAAEAGARVVKRVAPAAAASAPADPPGDAGAWWRTSRHEKRQQEMNPRRKFGDGARLAPVPTSAELKAKGKPVSAPVRGREAAAAATAHSQEDEQEEEEEAAAADEESEEAPARGGRAHTKAVMTAARPKAGKAGKAGKARAAAAAEEPDAEAPLEEEVRHGESGSRKKQRSGQLAKKTARAPMPTAEEVAEDEDAEDDGDESAAEEEEEVEEEVEHADETPAARAAAKRTTKRKPAPKAKKATASKAAAARARAAAAAEEADADEDVDTADEEEAEEAVSRPPPPRRAAASAPRGKKGVAAGKAKVPTRRVARGHLDDDGEDSGKAAVEDEEDEEDEEVVSLGKDGRARAVKHDSWDNPTIFEDDDDGEAAEAEDEDEEEAPPPPPKSLKKKKKLLRRA